MSEETPPSQPTIAGTPSRPEDQGVGPTPIPDQHGGDSPGEDKPVTYEPEPEITQLEAHTAEGRLVYLPQLISDEFAIQPDSARDMVLLGTVSIGGKVVRTERGWIPFSTIEGQEISVDSDVKSVRFRYRG